MGRPTLLSDEKIYEEVIENLALGISQVEIANALQVSESTITKWKKRKDFSRDLALRTIEISKGPIQKVKDTNPLAWLERRFRETWAPPTTKSESKNLHEIACLKIEFVKSNGDDPTT